jgi:HlyD family secretion protein
VGVDEADVGESGRSGGELHRGCYQDKRFPARVSQIRFGAETSGGVVTYKAVLGLDNSDLLLRPGMTATADIVVKKVTDALLVPNAALRFSPPSDGKSMKDDASNNSMISKLFPRPSRGTDRPRRDRANPRDQTVWSSRTRSPYPSSPHRCHGRHHDRGHRRRHHPGHGPGRDAVSAKE